MADELDATTVDDLAENGIRPGRPLLSTTAAGNTHTPTAQIQVSRLIDALNGLSKSNSPANTPTSTRPARKRTVFRYL